jgi:heme exporter protein D
MISIALDAHAHGHATPVLNTPFYATAALLIPVLFLAIAVQGRAFRQVINAQGHVATGGARAARRALGQPSAAWLTELRKASAAMGRLAPALIAVGLLDLAAILIIAAGSIGELLAVYALYQGHDDPGIRLTVLLSAALLTCVVIIEPVQARARIFRAVRRRRRQRRRDRAAGQTETG